jgi:hypothetical protein
VDLRLAVPAVGNHAAAADGAEVDARCVGSPVAGKGDIDRDRFRRAMERHLIGTQEMQESTGTRGRPAELFRRNR